MVRPRPQIDRRLFISAAALFGASTVLGTVPAWADDDEEDESPDDGEEGSDEPDAEEKLAQADAVYQRVASLQNELAEAAQAYYQALDEHETAVNAVDDAQRRIDEASTQIDTLQDRLAKRAVGMYKAGKFTVIDLLMGSASFKEFATGLDMYDALNENDERMIEETKALALGAYLASDVLGNFETNEIVTKEDGYATFLTALLRSARFGTEGVVGKANVICYNYLKQAGAFSRHQDGCYYIDYDAFHKGISSLVSETLELQGRGDFAAAKQFTAQYGNLDDDLKADAFNMMLEGIPVDVKFDFVW